MSSDEVKRNRAEVKCHDSERTPRKKGDATTPRQVDNTKKQTFTVNRRPRSAERSTTTKLIRVQKHALPTYDEYFRLEFRFDPEATQKSFQSASDDEEWNRRRHKDSEFGASVGREFDKTSELRNSKQDENDWNDEFFKEYRDYRRNEINEVHPCFDQYHCKKLMRQTIKSSRLSSFRSESEVIDCGLQTRIGKDNGYH